MALSERFREGFRPSLPQLAEGIRAGSRPDDGIDPVAGEERVCGLAQQLLDAKDGMQAPFAMDAQHLRGEVPAIVNHHVCGGRVGQKVESSPPVIEVGPQVERNRELRRKLNQAVEQALRIVAQARRRSVAAMDQRPRQVELRAVDRKQTMEPPAGGRVARLRISARTLRNTFSSTSARALHISDASMGSGCGRGTPGTRHCSRNSASVVTQPWLRPASTSRYTDSIATARGISVDRAKHAGIVERGAGRVRILKRDETDTG